MTISITRAAAIAALAALPAFGALALAPAGMAADLGPGPDDAGPGPVSRTDTDFGPPLASALPSGGRTGVVFGGSGPDDRYTGYDMFGRNAANRAPVTADDAGPDWTGFGQGQDPGELPPLDLASLREFLGSIER